MILVEGIARQDLSLVRFDGKFTATNKFFTFSRTRFRSKTAGIPDQIRPFSSSDLLKKQHQRRIYTKSANTIPEA